MLRRWIWIAIALVIGAAVLAMLGDVRPLAARLGGFRWPAFVAALGLALGNDTIRFARWTRGECGGRRCPGRLTRYTPLQCP